MAITKINVLLVNVNNITVNITQIRKHPTLDITTEKKTEQCG